MNGKQQNTMIKQTYFLVVVQILFYTKITNKNFITKHKPFLRMVTADKLVWPPKALSSIGRPWQSQPGT